MLIDSEFASQEVTFIMSVGWLLKYYNGSNKKEKKSKCATKTSRYLSLEHFIHYPYGTYNSFNLLLHNVTNNYEKTNDFFGVIQRIYSWESHI